MPKMKTNKAAKKRYSLTATGKVKRTKSNRRHLLANKTSRQKKTGKTIVLPLLNDIGWAVIDYIKNGRPNTEDQRLFI